MEPSGILPPADLIGQHLGSYRIVAEVGRGGMGIVYRARQPTLRRDVAIKVLPPRLVQSKVARQRFAQEAQTVARLQHPHILPIYDYGQEDGLPYLVMPLVRGGTLARWVGHPVPLARLLPLLHRVLGALAYAHGQHIVHRDLKPANILLQRVRKDDWPLLADFGIARILTRSRRAHASSSFAGTPIYMAPEQWQGRAVDPRTDVYAMGIVLYELLTGRHPFQGLTGYGGARLGDAVLPPSAVRPDLAPAWDEIVQRATARAPDERYASAAVLDEALQRAWHDLERGRGRGQPAGNDAPRAGAGAASSPRAEGRPRAGQLPLPPTRLVGRAHDVADALARLLLEDVRLLTLTGPGGIGKTRLGLQVAAEAAACFADGVHFVRLDAVHDPELVAPAIARTLRVQEGAGERLVDSVTESLRDQQVLLLLDNFEQVAPAAALVGDLLATCPALKVLATSRAPLRLRGEHEFPVPPLPRPDPQELLSLAALTRYAAVDLFLQRARAAQPAFALTAENAAAVAAICARLDGLPLAIELAAARIKVLAPAALLARLERGLDALQRSAPDAPPRQQTMRATIDWSYQLLSAEEQALLRWLAVFGSGCTLAAAEVVCGEAPSSTPDVLGGIAALVDQSLLEPATVRDADEPRFRMLELIRTYALDQLQASGELDLLRARHADYFLHLAEEAERELTGPAQRGWLARLDAEEANLREALRWSLGEAGDTRFAPDAELGVRLAGALWRFWHVRGSLSEGRRWLTATLAASPAAPAAVRAKALNGAGNLAAAQGDYAEATERYAESLSLRRTLGDQAAIAASLNNLGMLAQFQGDYRRATVAHEESLALRRALEDTAGVAASLDNLGNVAFLQENYGQATALYEEALALRHDLNDERGIAATLNNLGAAAQARGDHTRAAVLHEESLSRFRALDDKGGIAATLGNLATAAGGVGDYGRAIRLHEESLALFQELGDRAGLAECLEGLASVIGAQGHTERAVQLFSAAAALRDSLHVPSPPALRAEPLRALMVTRAALGEAGFAAAWSEGRTQSPEQIMRNLLAWTLD